MDKPHPELALGIPARRRTLVPLLSGHTVQASRILPGAPPPGMANRRHATLVVRHTPQQLAFDFVARTGAPCGTLGAGPTTAEPPHDTSPQAPHDQREQHVSN